MSGLCHSNDSEDDLNMRITFKEIKEMMDHIESKEESGRIGNFPSDDILKNKLPIASLLLIQEKGSLSYAKDEFDRMISKPEDELNWKNTLPFVISAMLSIHNRIERLDTLAYLTDESLTELTDEVEELSRKER